MKGCNEHGFIDSRRQLLICEGGGYRVEPWAVCGVGEVVWAVGGNMGSMGRPPALPSWLCDPEQELSVSGTQPRGRIAMRMKVVTVCASLDKCLEHSELGRVLPSPALPLSSLSLSSPPSCHHHWSSLPVVGKAPLPPAPSPCLPPVCPSSASPLLQQLLSSRNRL